MNFREIDKIELNGIILFLRKGISKMPDTNTVNLCRKICAIRKNPTLVFIIHDMINQSHVLEVSNIIGNRDFKHLDVIVHSGGGQINAAYQIIDLIKTHSENLTVIIPIYAKSAATLFVLGCGEIIMSELAELGPLDTQLRERKEGAITYSSALNPFKTLEELQRFTLRMCDQSVLLLINRADFSIEEAVKHSMDFAARIATSLFSQIKVERMGEYSRALQVGLEYGKRLLKRYGKLTEEGCDRILQRLIYQYPSHDYIIDYKEMKEIGFDVRLPTKEEGEFLYKIVASLVESAKNGETGDEIKLIELSEESAVKQ